MRCAPASETAPHRYSEDSRFTSLLRMPVRSASTSSLSRRGQRAPRVSRCRVLPVGAGGGSHAPALCIGAAVQARGLRVGDAGGRPQRQQQQQEGEPDHPRRVQRVEVQAGCAALDQALAQPGHNLGAECTHRIPVLALGLHPAADPARDLRAALLGKAAQLAEVGDRHDAGRDRYLHAEPLHRVDEMEIRIRVVEILGRPTHRTPADGFPGRHRPRCGRRRRARRG
ncbi:hypothetical protein G6F59_014273 [Rhizopus arrhizus]|nr:hypothetical protein G6F59_014273 [Rhizopus arrhizus]